MSVSVFFLTASLTSCGSDTGESSVSESSLTTNVSTTSMSAPVVTETPTSEVLATTEPPLDLPEPRPVDGSGDLAITATPNPDWISIGGGSAWVANVGDGLGRYDVATGSFIGSIPSGEICLAMDVGYGSLWVGDCTANTIIRIDVVTGAIQAVIPLPFTLAEESSIGAADGGVFVLSRESPRLIGRIDPEKNTVAATFDAPADASALRAGEGALWVSSSEGRLTRVDPMTGAEVASVPLGRGSRFMFVGEGSIWVLSAESGIVSRVDPATNAVVAEIRVSPYRVEGGDLVVGGGSVWARVSDVLVAEIDPATNTVVARFGDSSGSGSVAADDSSVWISAHDVTTVWRLARN